MRIIVQRVLNATLRAPHVNQEVVSQIDKGMFVLCGITHGDTEVDVDYLVPKLLKLRLWGDESGKSWNKNVVEIGGQILLVSQFTLYHTLKGSKPDFHAAMDNEPANELYNLFLQKLKQEYIKTAGPKGCFPADPVQPGSFGNYMNISTTCDGPVTLVIESQKDPKAVAKWEKAQARLKKQQGQTKIIEEQKVPVKVAGDTQEKLKSVQEDVLNSLVKIRAGFQETITEAINETENSSFSAEKQAVIEGLKADNKKLNYRIEHLKRALDEKDS